MLSGNWPASWCSQRIRATNENFKEEILDSIKTEPITIYHIGDKWWDLCAGPHVESTGKVPAGGLQLQSIAGAYWRGDETKPMLQVCLRFPFAAASCTVDVCGWVSVAHLRDGVGVQGSAGILPSEARRSQTTGSSYHWQGIGSIFHSRRCRWWTGLLACERQRHSAADRRLLEGETHRGALPLSLC